MYHQTRTLVAVGGLFKHFAAAKKRFSCWRELQRMNRNQGFSLHKYKFSFDLFVGWTRRRCFTGITVAICCQLWAPQRNYVRCLVHWHYSVSAVERTQRRWSNSSLWHTFAMSWNCSVKLRHERARGLHVKIRKWQGKCQYVCWGMQVPTPMYIGLGTCTCNSLGQVGGRLRGLQENVRGFILHKMCKF